MACSIKLPDGSEKKFSSPPDGVELAKSIGPRLAKDAVGLVVNGEKEIKDIRFQLRDGDEVKIVTLPSEESLEVIRHSSAHVLAQAVQNLWPEVKVTIGPVIEEGFYYDFDTDRKFVPEDLEAIEKEMKKIIKKDYEVVKEVWASKKAIEFFGKQKENLKQEIIRDLGEKEVSVYKQGDWLDLCRGPHVQRLGQIGAVKVLSLSGAYWRGDSKNQQLQRIYGTAFHTEKDLKSFVKRREEAAENDHRQLGKKLNLFWFSDLASGHPFFTPSGTRIYLQLQNWLRDKYKEYGYEEVITPQIFQEELFRQSGHLNHFKENMYAFTEEEQTFYAKPMNCPGHCVFYKKDRKSYRDLPWRVADFGRLHRKELGGALQGLTRVRSFCQDDAHVFCRMNQLTEEIKKGIFFMKEVYETLGLKDYEISLSTRPDKRMGTENLWDQAEGALREALKSLKLPFKENPGEGAFYGPKIDIGVRDAFLRVWQLGTFQCDFNLPQAFDLNFINEKGEDERPVMIHRALLGSLERFIGVYLEHCKGRLPLWLCPLQVVVLPLTDKELHFSEEIQKKLAQKEIICKIDSRNEKLSYKIRQSQLQQIPYMMIIGKKESQSGLVSLRLREGNLLSDLSLDEVVETLLKELKTKSLLSLFV